MSTPFPTAKINGVPVVNACSWGPTSGCRPNVAEFDVPSGQGGVLTDGAPAPVKLILGTASAAFENVYVLQQKPASVPFEDRVVVADWRWLWEYAWVVAAYNVRRAVGVKRLQDPTSVVLSPLADDLGFAPWSLKNHTDRWVATDVVKDIFNRYLLPLAVTNGFNAPTLSFTKAAVSAITAIDVENFEVDSTAGEAFAAALRYLPGVDCYVTSTGDVVVYSVAVGDDAALAAAIKGPVMGQGLAAMTSLARLRPSSIDVTFTRRVEVRFDYSETAGTTAPVGDTSSRILANVVQVTDYSLAVGANTVPQDTWIELAQAFGAWGIVPFKRKYKKPANLSAEDLRHGMVPFMDLLALLRSGKGDPGPNWAARIAAATSSYRQVFRIPRRWMDKIVAWDTSRVGTVDPTTATRGASAVYTDTSYLFTERSLYQEAASNADLSFVTVCLGYPTDDKISSVTTRTNALLQVVDEDQGVFRVAFHADKNALHTVTIPSQLEQDGDNTAPGVFSRHCGPTADPADPQHRGFAFDMLYEGGVPTVLCARHKLSVILTLQMAPGLAMSQPFSLKQPKPDQAFTTINVKPTDIRFNFLGRSKCFGPKMTIHVGPHVETARLAWNDDNAQDIDAIFGVDNTGHQPADQTKLDAATINLGAGGAQAHQGGSLNEIAQAVAARVWLALADRVAGSVSGQMDVSLVPAGWVPEVTHTISQAGNMWTSAKFPDRVRQINLNYLLDATTRRFIARGVVQGNS